jgi:carbon monoxide dehydrogenase subunit G
VKLEQSFEVAAPLEQVWQALIDVERVAPCLPGASVTGRNDDGTYNGDFKVKIGPTSAAYSGKLSMEDVDESAHTATMQAQGTDRRGQGGAKATIVSTLQEVEGGGTRVEVATDYRITGRLARFGRGGMIEDISNRLLGDFAKNLQASLATDGGAAGDGTAEAGAAAVAEAAAEGAAPAGAETIDAVSASEPAAGASEPAAGAAEPAAEPPPPTQTTPPPRPASPPPVSSEPVQGLSLMGSVLAARIKRDPGPAVAMLIGFLLALRVVRRRG